MLYLKEMNLEDCQKEYEFFKSNKANDRGFENPYYYTSYDDFINYHIPKRINKSLGIDLENGHVADTYYFLWNDDIIVGLFKVRHYLNDFLRNGSGHIGYIISKEYRGLGFGTIGLGLAIKKLIKKKDFNDKEIYLSCHKDNYASLRIMIKNGGYIHHSDEENHYVRIKVVL